MYWTLICDCYIGQLHPLLQQLVGFPILPDLHGIATKWTGYAGAVMIAGLNSYLVYTTLFPATGH